MAFPDSAPARCASSEYALVSIVVLRFDSSYSFSMRLRMSERSRSRADQMVESWAWARITLGCSAV